MIYQIYEEKRTKPDMIPQFLEQFLLSPSVLENQTVPVHILSSYFLSEKLHQRRSSFISEAVAGIV